MEVLTAEQAMAIVWALDIFTDGTWHEKRDKLLEYVTPEELIAAWNALDLIAGTTTAPDLGDFY